MRPDATRISRSEPVNGTHSVRAVVQSCTFLGGSFRIQARTADRQTAVAEVPRETSGFREGEGIYVWWWPHDEIQGLDG